MMNRTLFLLFPWLPLLSGVAQEESAARPKAPPVSFRVLESQEIDLGNRSLIYNRVAPPVLAESPPPPPPKEPVYSPKKLEIMRRREKKAYGLLFVSATVYDRQVTDLRWSVTGRNEVHAHSNIDFNLLAGMTEIETDDAVYLLLIAVGNETRQSVAEWNRSVDLDGWPVEMKTILPELRQFPAGRSTYMVVPDDRRAMAKAWRKFARKQGFPEEDWEISVPEPAAENKEADARIDTHAAMDALLSYYDAHRPKLAREYEKRQADTEIRARWLKENPPLAKDTVINFWPKRSTNYRGTEAKP